MASDSSLYDSPQSHGPLGDPSSSTQHLELKKDGTVSKMRSHGGNIPVLPKSKLCPHCPASFTRSTHLNRHLRTHTNERQHRCDTCDASFTRSDLLTRHKRSCGDFLSAKRTRRKSCQACADSKIKCDLQRPICSKCKSRDKECIFVTEPTKAPRRSSVRTMDVRESLFEGLDGLSPNFDPTTAYPPPELTTANLSSLEYLTSSTRSPPATASDYTPTDFQSAISALSSTNPSLCSTYSNDMFEPFLSNIFSSTADVFTQPQPNEAETTDRGFTEDDSFIFATQSVDIQPFMASVEDEWIYESLSNPSIFGQASVPARPEPMPPVPANPCAMDPPMEELQHYLYLFLTAFQTHIPLVHAATWRPQEKPAVLLGAAKACGAIFVKTKAANRFVSRILATARDDLLQEFAKNPTDSVDQVYLIIAVVLLQAIGLFHPKPDQRASSHLYHAMLVMMVRRSGLIARSVSWVPPNLTDAGSLDAIWQEWAFHEMTKRAILLSYLHDTCHCIYFAMSPSYLPNEMILYLPCEDALWRANTSTEWFLALQQPSAYGDINERLRGISMPSVLGEFNQQRILTTSIALNPFSHFVLIHAILRHLFSVCTESRLPTFSPTPQFDAAPPNTEIIDHEIMTLQYALHNWLQSWLHGPELPQTTKAEEEPPFICNVLPFYWLGQVALLAHQENYPPFEPNSENNLNEDVRFRLVKQWLKHIRGFLKKTDQAPTLFWDELMKIRLKSWQEEIDGGEDHNGLLAFFPEV